MHTRMVTGPTVVEQMMSVPPRMAESFAALYPQRAREWFVCSDPEAQPLGSGGGTVHLLVSAWQSAARRRSFADWLAAGKKLLIHAGGQGRRLPAYAPAGKTFIPIPAMRWALGQRLDQTLLDLQLPAYRRLLAAASARTVLMVASGDVLLRFTGSLRALPEVDVLIVGTWVKPEEASHHGVLFCPRGHPERLAFFRQKPYADEIRELAAKYLFLIDTGVWMLSERAVEVLLAKSGWQRAGQRFAGGTPRPYELYAMMGLGLGERPVMRDRPINALSCAVLPLPQGEFYHFGTSRMMIQSVSMMQNLVLDQTRVALCSPKPHPDQFTQNSQIRASIGSENHTLWIENSCIPSTWRLASEHVLTNVPPNDWQLSLPAGACLDFVPLDRHRFCVRFYRLDDTFQGPVGAAVASRLGIAPTTDWQDAPLFPVLERRQLSGQFLQWLVRPTAESDWQQQYLRLPRLSARELLRRADLVEVERQRAANREAIAWQMQRNHRRSVFYHLDLAATAKLFRRLPPPLDDTAADEPLKPVQDQMFRSAILRRRKLPGAAAYERAAFDRLRRLIIAQTEGQPVLPRCCVLEDQIVWGRAPVRLDLAGGWTDTPPYCLQHGGRVVNVAVNLNGQPPIQVFARVCRQAELVVRSIDLGVEERIRTYAELSRYDQVGSGFAIARAALALAGFLPRFHAHGGARTLGQQLRDFGGGIEVSLLCAVPKGSGLGTSSILAATLLGTLSELCGLGWDQLALFHRTLALEQMLTSGGGWQDQGGGLLRGIKLIETAPGLSQQPTVHWLPEHLFGPRYANQVMLLYYTGLTRVAKDILKEIVRSIFLNSGPHLQTLEEIGQNADATAEAIERGDWNELAAAIDRSWQLNQRLDSGTNPPPVQAILDRVADLLAATKLLGAGGGGYLLMLAKDETAARRIRQILTDKPPNPRARFVDFSLSETGFQVTRS